MNLLAVLMAAPAIVPRTGDEALIERFLAGDERAFTALYRGHVDRVFGLLTRLVGPVAEREDLVQQAFVDIYRALPGFRGEAAFSTFVYRIVTRIAYDHLSSRRRRRASMELDDALDELIADEPSPAERAQKRRDLERAFELLGRLKPKKRIAFVLVVVQGMSLREAADVVGATPDAVKQRVLHARREIERMEARLRRREDP
jgi:RNA polymerase sigma-70 factor (ECF subfamily)